ncbi:manganese efflux pump [Eubacterium sp. 1001713B170207_170306_E7]|uniref:manganese efflux pump n=1 Tax=Eubacterium sp. 1001713B170207_170306_E7 TaxID=2787097 RepID=UPI001896D519|nr:manganese efflux pump [Eubacterium sp. 1001713B170207_170306_E7]
MLVLMVSALLFSLSSNLDNIVVGLAFGIKKIHLDALSNLIVAVITTTGTVIAMLFGRWLSGYIPERMGNYLGAGIIMLLGFYFVIQGCVKLLKEKKSGTYAMKSTNEMAEKMDASVHDKAHIQYREIVVVALGLTFNNLGTGIAASITGVSIRLTAVCTFVISLAALWSGARLGGRVVGPLLGDYAPVVSGVLLVVLGLVEMFW